MFNEARYNELFAKSNITFDTTLKEEIELRDLTIEICDIEIGKAEKHLKTIKEPFEKQCIPIPKELIDNVKSKIADFKETKYRQKMSKKFMVEVMNEEAWKWLMEEEKKEYEAKNNDGEK